MPSLKGLRLRITSVKSTQKITSAMKMVAASKLRRAQTRVEAARPYAQRMERMLAALAADVAGTANAPSMLVGTGRDRVHLLVPITGERGLAGGFNSAVVRLTRSLIVQLEGEGKTVKVLAVGRKGRDVLRRELGNKLVGDINFAGLKVVGFAQAQEVASRIVAMLNAGEFDVCSLVLNRFRSVVLQVPTQVQLIPTPIPADVAKAAEGPHAAYEFEPDDSAILARLLPQNLAVQIYRSLLENTAGFYGSQMSAMDNATRNAGDMIKRLTLNYNRARQANITRELIEIISGAEAV
jgi:F-type H+-transporting ATPase subunit gamma